MASGSPYSDAGDDDADAITSINITPFVDVVLVLLVVFMVTAKLIVARGVDGIEQPRTEIGAAIEGQFRVSIDESGTMFVAGEPMLDDVSAVTRLRTLVVGVDKPKAIINGDARAAYGGVMRAITVVRAAGITSVALETASP